MKRSELQKDNIRYPYDDGNILIITGGGYMHLHMW